MMYLKKNKGYFITLKKLNICNMRINIHNKLNKLPVLEGHLGGETPRGTSGSAS